MPDITTKKMHSVRIDARKHINLTGIIAIDSFNEVQISLKSESGNIEVKGESLNVKHFDMESGVVDIDGDINSLRYAGASEKKQGFFRRMLK